jgi:hypothetical protein
MKELLAFEELADLAELSNEDVDSTSYEVWAIGYDEEDNFTGAELLLGTFHNPDSAVEFANSVSFADVLHLAAETQEEHALDACPAEYLSIEIETVISDEDGHGVNVGTIYKKSITISSSPDLVLSEDSFKVTDDGIKISKQVFDDFKLGESLDIAFTATEVISYKMVAEDTAWIYCEFTC